MGWLKEKLRKWLEIKDGKELARDIARNDNNIRNIDNRIIRLSKLIGKDVRVGIDHHLKHNSHVVILSNVNGHPHVQIFGANLQNVRELQNFVRDLKDNLQPRFMDIDASPGVEQMFRSKH